MWEQKRGDPQHKECDQCVSLRTKSVAGRLLKPPVVCFNMVNYRPGAAAEVEAELWLRLQERRKE